MIFQLSEISRASLVQSSKAFQICFHLKLWLGKRLVHRFWQIGGVETVLMMAFLNTLVLNTSHTAHISSLPKQIHRFVVVGLQLCSTLYQELCNIHEYFYWLSFVETYCVFAVFLRIFLVLGSTIDMESARQVFTHSSLP